MIKQRRKWPNFRTIVFLLAIFAISGLVAFYSFGDDKVALAAPNSTVYFDPATKSIGLNADFTLDAMIDPGSNQVNGVGLRITFDPTKFRLDGISNAGSPFSVALPGSSIDNNAGTASADFGISAGGQSVTTVSKVATLSFHSLAAVDNSPVAFSGATYAVATGESTDVLTTRNAAAVTVTGATYGNSDFASLVTDWLQTGASSADVNSDNVVNTRDLGIMMSNWQ